MAENARQVGLRLLRERAEGLHYLLQPTTSETPNGPDEVLVTQIHLIVNAAFLYCPEKMGKAIVEEISTPLLRAHGFCLKCGESALTTKDGKVVKADTCDGCMNGYRNLLKSLPSEEEGG